MNFSTIKAYCFTYLETESGIYDNCLQFQETVSNISPRVASQQKWETSSTQDDFGDSALHTDAFHSGGNTVRQAVECLPAEALVDSSDETPLHSTIKNSRDAISFLLNILLPAADINRSPGSISCVLFVLSPY